MYVDRVTQPLCTFSAFSMYVILVFRDTCMMYIYIYFFYVSCIYGFVQKSILADWSLYEFGRCSKFWVVKNYAVYAYFTLYISNYYVNLLCSILARCTHVFHICPRMTNRLFTHAAQMYNFYIAYTAHVLKLCN